MACWIYEGTCQQIHIKIDGNWEPLYHSLQEQKREACVVAGSIIDRVVPLGFDRLWKSIFKKIYKLIFNNILYFS